MRYYLIALFLVFFVVSSCFRANSDPYPPTYPEPKDGATDVSLDVVLNWYCEDPDGDELVYDVYFSEDPTPTLVASNIDENSYDPEGLEYSTTYHWKVVVRDGKGGENESPVWSFTTMEKPNSAPVWRDVPDQEVNEGSTLELNLMGYVNDPDGDEVRVELIEGPEGVVVENGIFRWTPDYESSGTHRVEVVAVDVHSAQATTSFLILVRDVNRPPDEPDNPDPPDGSTNVSTTVVLSWNCFDPDGDDLLYDVYFSEDPTPDLVASNIEESSYDPGDLDYSTTYYWKIVAKDGKGGEREGPVWSFRTVEMKVYAAVARKDGLSIIDVSDPESPSEVSFLDLDGRTDDVQVVGDYAYVANYDGVVIVDISDLSHPFKTGEIDLSGWVQSIRVVDDLAFVSAGGEGVVILDVSNPFNPSEISSFDTDGVAQDVDVQGDHAYVADFSNGLVVIDVSDPNNPHQVGHVELDSMAYGVRVSGDYAYVANYTRGLAIINVSDPSNPFLVKTVPMAGLVMDVEISGDTVSAACRGGGVKIIDVSDPENPIELGGFDTGGHANSVAIRGDLLFVADDNNGLVVLDASDPGDPFQVGHLDSTGELKSVDYTSIPYVFAADGEDGLKILNDYNGDIMNSYDVGYAVSVHGEYGRAFVAKGYRGVITASIQYTPALTIVEMGELDTAGFANSTAPYGDYLFVVDGNNGLVIVDVSDMGSPTEVGHLNTPGDAKDVFIRGDRAYVAVGTGGVMVLDISDPSNPRQISRIDTPGYAYSVFVEGEHVYVADYAGGFVAIDISDESNPMIVSNLDLNGFAIDIELNPTGDVAFVALQGYGFVVLDLNDLTNPRELARVETDGYMNSIDIHANTLYIAAGYGGLLEYDISDPDSPRCVLNTAWGPFAKLDIFERER